MKQFFSILILLISLKSFSQKIKNETFIENVYKDCLYGFKGDIIISAKSYPLGIYTWDLESLFQELAGLPRSVIKDLKQKAFQDTLIGLWECASFLNIKCVNTDTFDRVSHPRFYKFSRPVFDNGGKYALITMGHNCGMLCAYRCTYVYRYKNGKWMLLKKIDCWVS